MRDFSWNHSDPWSPAWGRPRPLADRLDNWEITPLELEKRLEKGDPVVLIDVREPWEAEIATIKGSVLIPLAELEMRVDEEIDRDDTIVVYCHHGMRSMEAAMTLWHLGFENVKNLAGGIARWTDQVDPDLARY